MLSKVQSLLIIGLLGFSGLHVTEGFRIARKRAVNTCPKHVLVNTKGDCVDAATNAPAAGCCKECVQLVQAAQNSYDKQINAYMTNCKLTPADVSEGLLVNVDKTCSQECQAMSMEDALMDFELSLVQEVCSTMPQRIVPLEPVAKLLSSFQTAWMECRAAPSTTTTTTELATTTEFATTTEELTTTKSLMFEPVQIISEARLLQDTRYQPDMAGQGRTRESSASACQARCAGVSGCAFFSFWADGGCHLQDNSATTESWRGATAGPATMSPVIGDAEWQLVRDSYSVAEGYADEKNELSVSVMPPNVPMHEIEGFRMASTSHDVVLNVKHAVFGGQAIKLEIQGEALYGGSFQGAGQFLKDVKLKVIDSHADFMHYVKAQVKAVEAFSHGSPTNPMASVALIVEIEAGASIIGIMTQTWKRTLKYTFSGNGQIQINFL